MRVIDLSHKITPDMPVYPSDPLPSFENLSTYDRDGFRVTMMHMGSHTGTHVDTPSHLYAQGATLGCMQLSRFVGLGVVIDCSNLKLGEKITIERIAHLWPESNGTDNADRVDFLLFRTGWDCYWGEPQYFQDFPVLDTEAAHYLTKTNGHQLKGIGFDTPSIDSPEDSNLTLHKIILGKGLVVFENLTGLDELDRAGVFTFCAMPLPCYDLEGSPVRAAAFLGN